jgi:site-specific DNA recombinase
LNGPGILFINLKGGRAMTVAVYARVSSDRQKEEETISSQLQQLRDFAAGNNVSLDDAHLYLDDGASGYYLDRPALDRLRDAARDGLIDILLVQNPDRLARKYAYQVLLLEEFSRWGVQVRFLQQPPPESPEQLLLVQIQGVISEYERARIMERTRRGRIYWARQGRPVCSHVPFGYRYISRIKDKPASVEIDEEAARIVRQIFEWYVDGGLSGHQIALRLTHMKIPSPKAHLSYWDPSSIRTILKNEAYLGTWYLNHYKREPRPGHIRPRTLKRPRQEWIPVPIPALISPQMFMKAQQIREQGGRGGSKPLRYPTTHLLRRLVVCKPCGRKMSCHNSMPEGYRYYWCRGNDPHGYKRTGIKCSYPTVSAPQLDNLVWADVVSLLTDPELLLCAWQEQNQMSPHESFTDGEIRRLRKQIAEGNSQRTRLIDAYQKGAIEIEELIARRNAIDERVEKAQKKSDTIARQCRERLSLSDLKKHIDEVCRLLLKGLESMDMEKKMKLCHELIDKVVVDKEKVEIHYRFPVSSNFNKRREHLGIFL